MGETPGIFMTLSAVIGGLALFMFGMSMMTQGLKSAAGAGLRGLLNATTKSSLGGLTLGTLGGLFIHSSATTVMLVGFVNAGLIDLFRSIPVVMGANIGTTLSMQIISFDLDAYSLTAIGLGFLLHILGRGKAKDLGRAVMGFGLLFLGLSIMKDSIHPHREAIQPLIQMIDGKTPIGMASGILLATLVTAIIQSSGATIGMAFAMIGAGVFSSVGQVVPIILGANIGTCATAMLGSVGADIDAKRCAAAHLYFNLINMVIAVFTMPLLLRLVEATSDDILRQTANFNTLIQVTATLVVLPLNRWFTKFILLSIRSRNNARPKSYLDESDLDRPEKAVKNLVLELQRITEICRESLRTSAPLILLTFNPSAVHRVRLNEAAVNEVKLAIQDYLQKLTQRDLSLRQRFLVQYLDRCAIAVERIGDHIDSLLKISQRRRKNQGALVDEESLRELFTLYQAALQVLDQVADSFGAAGKPQFDQLSADILEARKAFKAKCNEVKNHFADRQSNEINSPIAGIFYMQYIAALERLVRHAKIIARLEVLPDFWIKEAKLERVADFQKPSAVIHPHVHIEDFLKELEEGDE
jgi:phosphate:Na+ symporter